MEHANAADGSLDAAIDAIQWQAEYCRRNDAPVTGRVVAAQLAILRSDTRCGRRMREWRDVRREDAMPLRLAGGFHSLHLTGAEPRLASVYAGAVTDQTQVDAILLAVLADRDAELAAWFDGPPQTNEAGRSSSFVAAMLWLAERGLPARFECLEIGSSAGINLMIDRYAYDLGGVKVGPGDDAVMGFTPEWRGDPPPDRAIGFASLKGCDVAPIDLTDPAQALKLRAYTWPEHTVRFERLEAAIAAAQAAKPDLVRMDAADFVERELARLQAPGTTRVLMHSIVWQYVPEDQRERITRAMAAHGAQAAQDRALAWIALEADRTLLNHGLRVRYWPGGEDARLLAAAHAHGAWIEWMA